MPARTRKRKTSEEEEAGAEQVTKPATKTVRTSKRKPKVAQGPGDTTKSDTKASKKARTGASGSGTGGRTQAKPSASGAKRDIRKHADDLLHMLENRSHVGSSTARGSLFSSKVDAVLKETGDIGVNQAIDTRCVVFDNVHGRIKHLQELMDEFDTINKSSINIKKPTEGQQWSQDAEDIAKVDKKAMEVAIQMLNSVVISGEYSNLSRASAGSGSEVEQAAWRWLEGGVPPAEDTWGSAARETVRAFAGITKLLS
ncbi:hypothetical protein TgHK011_003778 [Trichoderma gracile]|nr:hypothetical protein TgHK011_003778 [Trichoderma gracile]